MNNDLGNISMISELPDFVESLNLAKYTSSIIDEKDGREIVIHILDIWDKVNEDTREIWLDLIERAGFYPYFKDKQATIGYRGSIQGQIRSVFFKSDYLPDIYFHERQKEIEMKISLGQNLAVSAPTSFGKSLLIEEIVARNKFANILIIQPTLALIDETRQKLKKYSGYNLVVNTRQAPKERNIFILTAERVFEFPNLPKIDFFIVDEFYKVSRRRDNRIDPLNIAIYNIMKMKPQILFLTPVVDNLSENLIKKYGITFYKTDYQLVNTKIKEVPHRSNKNKKLYELLTTLKEPTIVYVKAVSEAYKLANGYLDYLTQNNVLLTLRDLDVFSWIDENISSDWQLKRLMSHGIGIHCGAIPRHIATSEVNYFNFGKDDKKLDILFATTSLIEGVNTSAKNIVFFSKYKGDELVDYFDFTNISGRAGRMNQYFTGNVYLFENIPEKMEDFVIDVPIIDQSKISDEMVVNLDRNDVKEKDRFDSLQEKDEALNEIIKKNLINIRGQKELVQYIENNLDQTHWLLSWTDKPSRGQLEFVLHLGYKYLREDEKPSGYITQQAMTALAFAYGSLKTAINDRFKYYSSLVGTTKGSKKQREDPLNSAITDILYFQRREAAFTIPKLLGVIDSLQRYILQKHNLICGDYSVFSALLENEQIQPNLQFLIDFGVPASAILKIQRNIGADYDEITVKNLVRSLSDSSALLDYEKNLLRLAVD